MNSHSSQFHRTSRCQKCLCNALYTFGCEACLHSIAKSMLHMKVTGSSDLNSRSHRCIPSDRKGNLVDCAVAGS